MAGTATLRRLFNVAPGGWGYAGGAWPGAESGSQYVDLGHSVGGVQNVLSQAFSVSSAANYDLTWYDNTAAFPGHTYTTTYSVEVINNVNSQVVAGGISTPNTRAFGLWSPSTSIWPRVTTPGVPQSAGGIRRAAGQYFTG